MGTRHSTRRRYRRAAVLPYGNWVSIGAAVISQSIHIHVGVIMLAGSTSWSALCTSA